MLEETETYITIKDHKSEFPNKIQSCLINLYRSSIGKISMVILDRINERIISSVTVNQWENTSVVLKWYNKIPNKTKCSFIQFDIQWINILFLRLIQGSTNLIFACTDFCACKVVSCTHSGTQNYVCINSHCGR